MRITRFVLIVLLITGIGLSAGAQSSIDVTIVTPDIDLTGDLADPTLQSTLDSFLQSTAIGELESEIENDPDLQKYSTLPLLTKAAANAGSAAAHLGTQRAFSDYRVFALVVGTGAGLAAPGVDPAAIAGVTEDLETEGDIYVGAGIQPVTASLGINLSRWIPRTRADVKLGFANIAEGTIDEGLSFNALSVGVGANYQLLQSRQLPLGFVRWRGLTLASGFMYQRNETNLTVEVADSSFDQAITYADLGLTDSEVSVATSGDITTASTELAVLSVSPSVAVGLESKTYTIPLEVSTGLRLLWLLDVNLGAGVDLVFGESELTFGADARVDVESGPGADQYIDTTPGSVGFGVTNTEAPQFFRPRITGGVGVNLGPVKLDVPLMMYFDADGNTVMAGVNVGIVF